MREFEDEDGVVWSVGVKAHPGMDFKGRYIFSAKPAGTAEEAEVHLDDVRWNSERTAVRTLQTMSLVELRRRLGWARGRASPAGRPS